MTSSELTKTILDALHKVEHPSIAATLLDLGMVRNIEINEEGKVDLILVLPFPAIPEQIRTHMINSLAQAAKAVGGEIVSVQVEVMNDEEKQTFMVKEQANWRG